MVNFISNLIHFSTRFSEMFPAVAQVRELQTSLDDIIQQGVTQITRLVIADQQSDSKFVIAVFYQYCVIYK